MFAQVVVVISFFIANLCIYIHFVNNNKDYTRPGFAVSFQLRMIKIRLYLYRWILLHFYVIIRARFLQKYEKKENIIFSHGLLCKTWIVPPLGVNDLVIYIYIYLFSSCTFREKHYSSDSSEPIWMRIFLTCSLGPCAFQLCLCKQLCLYKRL